MDPDQQLIANAARGDHRDSVYRFACWMLDDRATAEDVVQDSFLALLRNPTRFDPSLASLRRHRVHLCRHHWRRLAPEVEMEDDATGEGSEILMTPSPPSHPCSARPS